MLAIAAPQAGKYALRAQVFAPAAFYSGNLAGLIASPRYLTLNNGLITISALNYYGASLTLLSVADTVKPLKCTVGKRLASLLAAFAARAG